MDTTCPKCGAEMHLTVEQNRLVLTCPNRKPRGKR